MLYTCHNWTSCDRRLSLDINLQSIYKQTDHGRWKNTSIFSRFFDKVLIDDINKCWEWIGSKNQKGRGMVNIKGKTISAPRLAWFIYNKQSLNDNIFVCHHCDNPSCVNLRHLWLGTNADNIKDMYNKNRRVAYRGEKVKNSKLTNEQARLIKELYMPRTNKRRHDLAKIFSVSESVIQGILYRGTYID